MENPRYHIQIDDPDAVGKYVILPGDRGRVERIAKYLQDPVVVGSNREYYTMTGTLGGHKVSVMSTGMGAPCISIGVEELKTLGVHTCIRVGTAGAMQPRLGMGDSVIATGAIRDDGTMDQYLPKSFPAVADFEVVQALREAAADVGNPAHLGVVYSTDSYYARNFDPQAAQQKGTLYARAGALVVEMEVSALYLLGNILGLRAGAVLTVREQISEEREYRLQAGQKFEEGLEKSIQIAVQAIEKLLLREHP
ncbi:MAG TPA: nucleoside phosphorylase [Thermotogota bacterium]|nr:nucleoside phosphorylase [Thermotogota bacterium]HRW93002.1 nucleoside phosphorylase [Thermotogota bacterium]